MQLPMALRFMFVLCFADTLGPGLGGAVKAAEPGLGRLPKVPPAPPSSAADQPSAGPRPQESLQSLGAGRRKL